MPGRIWAIVLAGGEGSRLREHARDHRGRPAPKQFCPLGGMAPPLAAAIARADALVARERVMVSVIEAHRPWWSAQLSDRPEGTIVSQPLARGTAAGVLLPLLAILERDPAARVLLLPADHAVEDEHTLRSTLERAAWVAGERPDHPVLLGMTPTSADGDLGWVMPAGPPDTDSCAVESFVEKPGPERARRLMAAGAMWNAFLVASKGRALMRLFARHLPELLAPLSQPERSSETFATLPIRDFSHDLLTPAGSSLRVVRVPPCGWTDLGTPARLLEWLASHGATVTEEASS